MGGHRVAGAEPPLDAALVADAGRVVEQVVRHRVHAQGEQGWQLVKDRVEDQDLGGGGAALRRQDDDVEQRQRPQLDGPRRQQAVEDDQAVGQEHEQHDRVDERGPVGEDEDDVLHGDQPDKECAPADFVPGDDHPHVLAEEPVPRHVPALAALLQQRRLAACARLPVNAQDGCGQDPLMAGPWPGPGLAWHSRVQLTGTTQQRAGSTPKTSRRCIQWHGTSVATMAPDTATLYRPGCVRRCVSAGGT